MLRDGEIEIVGRLIGSSNHAMLARVTRICPPPEPPQTIEAVYKPTAGERPLDDFPDGTLSRREVAAYPRLARRSAGAIVPPTVLREGPFGEGALQPWIDVDEAVDMVAMVLGDDPRLRRIAVFDAAVNNTDRKGGHLLPVDGARTIYGVDHGVCFSTVAEAPDGPLGLARASRSPPTSGPASSGSRRRAARRPGPASWRRSCRGPRSRPRGGESTRCSIAAASRYPRGDWPAIPWPPF